MQACLLVGLIDDPAERRLVDQLLALIGRERVGRLVERLARDHVIAAGEVLAVATQVDARKDDLGAGGADIDADADQRHMVLQPDRVLLDGPVVVELEMVVIVVGVLVVLVDDILAIEMVGKAVSHLWFLVFGISHQQSLLMPSLATSNVPTGNPVRHGQAQFGRKWPDRLARWRLARWRLGRSVSPFNKIGASPGAQTVRFPPGPACLGAFLSVFRDTIIIYRTFI